MKMSHFSPMANVDWDLFSIVRSCKASSLTPSTIFETSPQSSTTTTMNKITSLQNYTPSYFHDFPLSHENKPIPFSPLKSNDFLQIGNFTPNFNPNTTIPAIVNPVTNPASTILPKPSAYVEITTAHFDLAYNHPLILQELQREHNHLPIQVPQTTFRVVPNPLSQPPKRKSWKKKSNDTTKVLECHLSEEKIKEDPWTWRKYGEKIIKGSSHPRSYYKCSSFIGCTAKKLVEKSKNKENTYVVMYKGQHNHKEAKCNHKSVNGASRKKSSKTGLSTAKLVKSSSNVSNMGSPNHTENIDTQTLSTQSKVLYPENHLLVSQEAVSSSNVGNFSSSDETTIPYSGTKSIGSCDDDDDDYDILIPNMRAMSEDILLDFNHLNGGRLFS